MGYPSDHYPIVVEVRAKLKAKPRHPPTYSKFAVPEEHQVALYRSLVTQRPPQPIILTPPQTSAHTLSSRTARGHEGSATPPHRLDGDGRWREKMTRIGWTRAVRS